MKLTSVVVALADFHIEGLQQLARIFHAAFADDELHKL